MGWWDSLVSAVSNAIKSITRPSSTSRPKKTSKTTSVLGIPLSGGVPNPTGVKITQKAPTFSTPKAVSKPSPAKKQTSQKKSVVDRILRGTVKVSKPSVRVVTGGTKVSHPGIYRNLQSRPDVVNMFRERAKKTVKEVESATKKAVKESLEKGTNVSTADVSTPVRRFEQETKQWVRDQRKVYETLRKGYEAELKKLEEEYKVSVKNANQAAMFLNSHPDISPEKRKEMLRLYEMYKRKAEKAREAYNRKYEAYKNFMERTYGGFVELTNKGIDQATGFINVNLPEAVKRGTEEGKKAADLSLGERLAMKTSELAHKGAETSKKSLEKVAGKNNPAVEFLAQVGEKTVSGVGTVVSIPLTVGEDVVRAVQGKQLRTPVVGKRTLQYFEELGAKAVSTIKKPTVEKVIDLSSEAVSWVGVGEVLGAAGKAGKAAVDKVAPKVEEVKIGAVVQKTKLPTEVRVLGENLKPKPIETIEKAVEYTVIKPLKGGEEPKPTSLSVLVDAKIEPGKPAKPVVEGGKVKIDMEFPKLTTYTALVEGGKKVYEKSREVTIVPPPTKPIISEGVPGVKELVKGSFENPLEASKWIEHFNKSLVKGGEGSGTLLGVGKEWEKRLTLVEGEKKPKLFTLQSDVLTKLEGKGKREPGLIRQTVMIDIEKRVKRVPFWEAKDILGDLFKKAKKESKKSTPKSPLDVIRQEITRAEKEKTSSSGSVVKAKQLIELSERKGGGVLERVKTVEEATNVSIPSLKDIITNELKLVEKRLFSPRTTGETRARWTLRLFPSLRLKLRTRTLEKLSLLESTRLGQGSLLGQLEKLRLKGINSQASDNAQTTVLDVGLTQTTTTSTVQKTKQTDLTNITPVLPRIKLDLRLKERERKSTGSTTRRRKKELPRSSEKVGKKKARYTPSVLAEFLDIRSKKPVLDVTGLALRPVIGGKKK